MEENDKKVIVITGGSDGLGKAITKILCAPENQLVVISNNKESLSEVECELSCSVFECDISDADSVQQITKQIYEQFGRIDTLINNAGIYLTGELLENDYEKIEKVIDVNTVGTIFMTKAVAEYMKLQNNGKILNIVSINGVQTKAARGPYIASKYAITGFTGSMQKELAKFNIKVMGLYPGLIKTTLFDHADAKRDLSAAMEPEEVARVVQFVLSFDSDIVFDPVVFKKLNYIE